MNRKLRLTNLLNRKLYKEKLQKEEISKNRLFSSKIAQRHRKNYHKEVVSIGSALASTGSLIIIQFAIMMAIQAFKDQQKKAKEENQSNFLKIKSGQTTLGQDYKVSKDIFGKITYRNQ
jgi:large-conductance mechanosensitive channel